MDEQFEEKQAHSSSGASVENAPSIDGKFETTEILENEIVPGSENVTYEELKTLRHVSDSLPLAAFLVIVLEFAERWSYYGTTNIYNNYIRAPLPRGSINGAVLPGDRLTGVAGALGRGQPVSFALRTFNSFFVYAMPLVGGVISDTIWGRYKTIIVFSIVCFFGHVIITASATPVSIAQPGVSLGLLVLAILVIGIGAGGIKASVSPMVAEQYTGTLRKKTLESGETVVVSPEVTIQSIYMWFFAAINLGATGAISASFISRNHGYWVAFLVPTCIFLFVPLVLLFGRKTYVVTPPRGSILLECLRVIGMSLGPAWSVNPVVTVRRIKAPNFWDPSRPSTYAAGTVPARITWDDEFVDEVSRTLNALNVFLFFPFFRLCYSQIDGNLSTTAAGMTVNGTPNDLIQNLNPISIIILIPIFDKGIYPFLRKRGINFTPIKRIYAGFLVAGLAMVYASVLQHFIAKTSPCGPAEPSACYHADGTQDPSPINVWVVSGPYILVGIAEIFASITSLEYAFTKAPARMKSVVMAFSQLQSAISAALNFALVSVNTEPKFTWLYGSFAVVAWVTGNIFFVVFRDLDRREHELNAIGKGDRPGFSGETPEMTTVRRDPDGEVVAPLPPGHKAL